LREPRLLFVDVHVHLADPAYAGKVNSLLETARKENVVALVSNSMDLETAKVSAKLAACTPELVYAAVGFHPWNAQTTKPEEVSQIDNLVHETGGQIIAVGEIGLDRSYAKTSEHFEQQRWFFEKQLDLAEKMNLPVIVHSRGSARDVLDTLESRNQKKVLMHWYSGPVEYVKEICDNGWTLSLGPSILYSGRVREVALKASPESVLSETDGPVTYRGPFLGKETTPAFVRFVVEEVARILKTDLETVSHQIYDNFHRFFEIKRRVS